MGNGPFWVKTSREPFGAKFWQFGGFRAATKTAFCDYWETVRFGSKSWPDSFWIQILAVWRLLGRQLKAPSGTIGRRPVLGQILAGTLLESEFGYLAASGLQLKTPSGTIWKRPVLGQILAGSLLEPNFGNLAASGPQLKPPSGTIGKGPVLGQIPAGSLLEPNFGNLAASGPANKSAFWNYWETARFGPNPSGSLLEPNFSNLAASGPQVKPPSGTIGKRPVFGQILAGEPFGAKFWQFGCFRAAIKTAFSDLLGNGPFWVKSWPGAFWSQILAIWRLPGRN